MTWGDGILLAFVVFNTLVLLVCWWLIHIGQKTLDRHMELDEQAWQEAIRRLPP